MYLKNIRLTNSVPGTKETLEKNQANHPIWYLVPTEIYKITNMTTHLVPGTNWNWEKKLNGPKNLVLGTNWNLEIKLNGPNNLLPDKPGHNWSLGKN